MAASNEVKLFCSSKMGKTSLLPKDKGLVLRPLQRTDYAKGFAALLQQLTDVEGLTNSDFEKRFDEMKKDGHYFIVVVEDSATKKVIGGATLLIEDKFVHKNGKVGHIEDVVVDTNYRKHNIGLVIIDQLKQIGWAQGAYKIILDCSDKNIGFYERCGFSKKEIQMALYKSKL
jgi:glucosamine-phosphate N-acetyltransferase